MTPRRRRSADDENRSAAEGGNREDRNRIVSTPWTIGCSLCARGGPPMSYRPITDTWYCVRPKLKGGVKYYGAYPAGFLERARVFMGVHINDPVLHVCAGYAHLYPYEGGYGPNDKRLDLNPACEPDFLQDARDPYPRCAKAIMADPPYSEPDAEHYPPGSDVYPRPRLILQNALEALEYGQRVGILQYVAPRPPEHIPVKFIAKITVSLGYDNRDRTFSVFERRA